MKKIIIILLIIFPFTLTGQIINWDDFNERHMDTVMFNIMNNYRHQIFQDSLTWSSVVQSDIMSINYEFIKTYSHLELHSLHNMKWADANGLPKYLKDKIINENINPYFLNSQIYTYKINEEGDTKSDYGKFNYSEILVSIPKNNFKTYQEIGNHAIHSWNKSIEGHATIMNANYKNKVIVGTVTFYSKASQRIFISFVYIT